MARAKRISEVARAMMKISVEVIFCGLSNITVITRMLKKKLSRTENSDK
jgi:hypothetical protein